MKHDEFIGKVQNLARLASRGDAERATRAVLQTLGERIGSGEAKDLASQLPPQLAEYTLSGFISAGERFNVDEFCQRVLDREGPGVQPEDAIFHAKAVIHVLQEAVSQGEIHDILSRLPAEYDRLFRADIQSQRGATDQDLQFGNP